jgi:NADH-quinone oxidoreductase subunit A
MISLLFAPPIIFFAFVILFFLGSKGLSRYANPAVKGRKGLDAYACGQRNIQNYVNPDYSEFFPLAFFFTLMHVFTLVVTTAPYDAQLLPAAYIVSGILAMVIIFRK